MDLTILMPCLNEAETIADCVSKAKKFLDRSGLSGEVLVADNGSTDGSRQFATQAGARVVQVPKMGYGNALNAGIRAALGRYVIMGDADDSYDFETLDEFVMRLRDGADLVMGNRFKGSIAPGAMPPLHRYFGNPVLSWIGRVLFKTTVGDFHCGLRGFKRDSVLRLGLHTGGMEFASELVARSALAGYRIEEVATTLVPAGRSRAPHLRSWRDGWRHLRFMLLLCPKWLFLYPGLALLVGGMGALGALVRGPQSLGGVYFDIHTLLYASAAVTLGMQMCMMAVVARVHAARCHYLPPISGTWARAAKWLKLERALLAGSVALVFGLAMATQSLRLWWDAGLGSLEPSQMMRLVIPSVTLMICGGQLCVVAMFWALIDSGRAFYAAGASNDILQDNRTAAEAQSVRSAA